MSELDTIDKCIAKIRELENEATQRVFVHENVLTTYSVLIKKLDIAVEALEEVKGYSYLDQQWEIASTALAKIRGEKK